MVVDAFTVAVVEFNDLAERFSASPEHGGEIKLDTVPLLTLEF